MIAATAGCLLVTSCSSGKGDDSESVRRGHLKGSLCETGISTRVLREMHPGPYLSTEMIPSKHGGIDGIDGTKGNTERGCDVRITKKGKDTSTLVTTLVRAEPRSVDDLFERYKNFFPAQPKQRLELGPAKGYTTSNDAVLAFDCRHPKKRTSKNSGLGVSVEVVQLDDPDSADSGRSELAKGAAELAADTARYVSSTVLKCSSPRLPDGAPDQKPRAKS
ncbi:hypothetical protein HCC61_25315 [Streptomyces sp. HNM0575]|uniref:hypothetical protein n=1 Tax=Streptomyces sp. HNM0575 TaxID=2716338 RepID=UPI00145D119F|nr:hypothetical protein [Streptomyces sp. HNM0575]NLU75931.1 hypothetical protein [Streptomyces sp. HNM0575]